MKSLLFKESGEMSHLQLELLRHFGNGVMYESLREIKVLLVKYFADKVSGAKDKVWEEKT